MSGHEVAGGVVKVVELVGSSESSFSDAVRNAVATASRTIRHIEGVDVIGSSAVVGEDGGLTLYKVHCKVAFRIEDGQGSASGRGAGLADGDAGTTRTEQDIQDAFE